MKNKRLQECNCEYCRSTWTTIWLRRKVERIAQGIKGLVFKQPDAHKA